MKIKIFIARLFLILFISLLIYSSFKIIMWYKDNINTSSNNNNIKNISKEIIKDDNTVDVDFNQRHCLHFCHHRYTEPVSG